MAKKLYSPERIKIEEGKPKFPRINQNGKEILMSDMSDLVTHEFWLKLNMLGLCGY